MYDGGYTSIGSERIATTSGSGGYYISTTAGLLLERSSFKQLTKKLSWNEMNKKDLTDNYTKIVHNKYEDEYSDKKSFILGTVVKDLTIQYLIYYYEGQIKIVTGN